jgi:galactonate dehydratase
MELRRSTNLRLLTGEKMELVRGFRPFLDNGAVDVIHPDLCFSGGITGTKKLADYAALSRTPVALHNVGGLVMTYANAQFAVSIQNFFKCESALAHPGRYVEAMAASNPPQVSKGEMTLPKGVGLAVDLNPDFLKKNLAPGEQNEGLWEGYDGEWSHASRQLIALAEATPPQKFSWRVPRRVSGPSAKCTCISPLPTSIC